MPYETIILTQSDHIARITLNRPDRLNAFTRAMHAELADALDAASDARVIVLTGAGRGFCAGQDLNDRAVAADQPVDLGETVEASWNPLIHRLAAMPQPVIARVNGVAAGAGANIALASDMVVAAKSAKFIQSFSALGLIPDSGGSWHLPRLIGQARALGLAAIKSIIRTSPGRTLDEELDLQRDEMRRLGFTRDYHEGVAAFLEKRPARFEGR